MISRSVGVCLFVCSAGLLIFPLSASSQTNDWTFCAWEGGVCAFTGTQEVRYGANGSYTYETLSGGTACTNSVFGDPAVGVRKECATRASDWTFCAWEGGVCAFTGTQEVRYGANGSYTYETLSNGTACTNSVFGDPAVGVRKECATRASDWTFCAWEGGVCAFAGTQEVRYGANGSYTYETLSDGTACTNSVFGDPAVGVRKECAIRASGWTFCAWEGGVCAFAGTKEVRYGANGSYTYEILSDGTACTNSVFGDPARGIVKRCDIRAGSGSPPTPNRAVFVPSSNHNTVVVEYVLEIFPVGADPTAANPVAAQNLGKPPVVNGECEADVRQTIANLPPGNYIATVSAFGNGILARSAPSAPFTR